MYYSLALKVVYPFSNHGASEVQVLVKTYNHCNWRSSCTTCSDVFPQKQNTLY